MKSNEWWLSSNVCLPIASVINTKLFFNKCKTKLRVKWALQSVGTSRDTPRTRPSVQTFAFCFPSRKEIKSPQYSSTPILPRCSLHLSTALESPIIDSNPENVLWMCIEPNSFCDTPDGYFWWKNDFIRSTRDDFSVDCGYSIAHNDVVVQRWEINTSSFIQPSSPIPISHLPVNEYCAVLSIGF